jgi:lipopolysaccharide transport system ATP-binding protein
MRRQPIDQVGTTQDTFWALDDVSFNVHYGERVGIIGRNGAGKSTLLKILSRVVYPTSGEARIRGRLVSLLEVGTGFNGDLTGRENVYLNASIHGLSRPEIRARFDNIVEFSGVQDFLDTPVKRYSSGMQMRLAFSVAAHLDPDILLLDEVLTVGDLEFQQKCLERVEALVSEGRTLLFVSHSLEALTNFCDRSIWLEGGRIRADGPTERVLDEYRSSVPSSV